MKCPKCNGKGSINNIQCPSCEGFGQINEQTNDEWRRTCSTEEFAKWLSDTLYACMRCGMNCHIGYCPFNKCIIDKEDALAWLKEKHE